MPGAAQRMSPGDLERAWCGTTYVTGRPGACLVRHNLCHRATWSVPGAAQRMSPGDLERRVSGGNNARPPRQYAPIVSDNNTEYIL